MPTCIENEREEAASPAVHIDPQGDIFLVVQNGSSSKDIRVSSKILSAASVVFKTIFQSGFREGLGQYPSSTLAKILLPEDDADALTTVCRVVHYRAREVPREFAANELLQIGRICDKYDFIEALQLGSSSWLRGAIARVDIGNMHPLLEAAYLLDGWEEFSQISVRIIVHHVGGFTQGLASTAGDWDGESGIVQVLDKSLDFLEAERQDWVFAVIVAVERAATELFSISHSVAW